MLHQPSGAARGQVCLRENPCSRPPPPAHRLAAAAGGAARTECLSPPHPLSRSFVKASDMNNEARELLRIRSYLNTTLASSVGKPVVRAFKRHFTASPLWCTGVARLCVC